MAEKTQVEQARRELKRKSLDQLKIYNPLNEPITTIYDGYTYSAPPKEESRHLRYIAKKMIKEFCDDMINKEEQARIDVENDKRTGKGFQTMNPQERDTFDIQNKLTTDNEEKIMQYTEMIYRGISQEHGLDIPEPEPVKKDRSPRHEKILAQLDAKMGIVNMIPDEEDPEDLKDELLEKIK